MKIFYVFYIIYLFYITIDGELVMVMAQCKFRQFLINLYRYLSIAKFRILVSSALVRSP
jgi:hypothetical protein